MTSDKNTIIADSGARIQVQDFCDAGGQGCAHLARHLGTGEAGILKILNPDQATPANAQRIRHIVAQRIDRKHAAFAAPFESITQRTRMGHFARRARGVPLDHVVYGEVRPYMQMLTLALAIAAAMDALHELGWIHGDIHPGNVIVYSEPGSSILRIEFIDFDNFRTDTAPLPSAAGHPLYLAPELRFALRANLPTIPDIASDRFALGVLLHEVLLLKHPATGFREDPDAFERIMTAGIWPHDPLRRSEPVAEGGYPSRILDCNLASLFRRAASLDPAVRPAASEWVRALANASQHVNLCEHCSGPCVADASQKSCPICAAPFPPLALVVEQSGRRIPLDNGCVRVGRPEFSDDPTISSVHAVFRQFGPEFTVQSLGRNGVWRKASDGEWSRLPDGIEIPAQKGDHLRFTNACATIE